METFRLTIKEDTDAVDFVAFVDKPAIERNFIAFNKDAKRVSFNEELRIVTTPVLIPDQLIYRNQNGKEFYLVALKEDVTAIYNKFVKDANFNKLNLMHDANNLVENKAHLYEIFLSDERRGISAPKDFADLPNNTWFASYKINDDQMWNDIKEGKINGVSIEGFLSFETMEDESDIEMQLDEMLEKLTKILNK